MILIKIKGIKFKTQTNAIKFEIIYGKTKIQQKIIHSNIFYTSFLIIFYHHIFLFTLFHTCYVVVSHLTGVALRARLRSCFSSIEKFEETLIASSSHSFNFGAVLVDLESGHCLNASCLSGLTISINIYLSHLNLRVVWNMTFKDRSNALAWWAPSRCKVNH